MIIIKAWKRRPARNADTNGHQEYQSQRLAQGVKDMTGIKNKYE